jgi:preprotein translocase subunit SecA
MAGMALQSGRAVEIQDNGINYLVALLPAYLSVLQGHKVHYVTTTTDVARRSFLIAEGILAALGVRPVLLSERVASAELDPPESDAEVTYGSYRQLAYRYLGNNIAQDPSDLVEANMDVAIVDQIDAILIDQATLSAVIRTQSPPEDDCYRSTAAAALTMERDTHYTIDLPTGKVSFRDDGLTLARSLLRVDTLTGLHAARHLRYLENAVRAKDFYRRGSDYEVDGLTLAINTGQGSRLANVERLNDGIRQALEAHEGLPITDQETVCARIALHDYFNRYTRLSGLSAVAGRSRAELNDLYNLNTVVMPRIQQITRFDHAELLFELASDRLAALIGDAVKMRQRGQPVVIAVQTDNDRRLAEQLLEERKVGYSALGSGDAEVAGAILGCAGNTGSVTLVTGDVTRGHDITVPSDNVLSDKSDAVATQGLAILCAGRSRSWRTDQSLRGLAGRRGDPGESRFYLSEQDPQLRRLHSKILTLIPRRLRRRADGAEAGASISNLVDKIQAAVEQVDVERRRKFIAFDEVEESQCNEIYILRNHILQSPDLADYVNELITDVVSAYVRYYEDAERLLDALTLLYPTRLNAADLNFTNGIQTNFETKIERITTDVIDIYKRDQEVTDLQVHRDSVRRICLAKLDLNWRRHLLNLEFMRTVIYADSNPLDRLGEYRDEARGLYALMSDRIKEQTFRHILQK